MDTAFTFVRVQHVLRQARLSASSDNRAARSTRRDQKTEGASGGSAMQSGLHPVEKVQIPPINEQSLEVVPESAYWQNQQLLLLDQMKSAVPDPIVDEYGIEQGSA